MAYAKLFSTITESSLWSASKDARLLFMSMLAKADSTGFVEAALPGLARLANLTLGETAAALAELMAPDPYSKSPDCGGARVVKVERGWCLVNYEVYRDRKDDDAKREYMRNYMREYRAGKLPVNVCKSPLGGVGQAEAEASPETEAESSSPAALVLQEGEKPPLTEEQLEEGSRKFLEGLGATTRKRNGEDLLPEWKRMTKGLKAGQVEAIFAAAKPGIEWPSEFKQHRMAKGI